MELEVRRGLMLLQILEPDIFAGAVIDVDQVYVGVRGE
ncbi:MAG: hypothetical protein ACI81P_003350 [Neolewinella sp.]|jgi:hypothetical protein